MPPPRDEDAPGIVIERAEIPGTGLVDLRVAAGRVTALVPHGAALPEGETLRVIDAKARALLPGLHDHHIHLLALAAALGSVRCGPPEVQDREALGAALRAAVPGEDGWIRGTGYHDSVAGPLGCALLDYSISIAFLPK